MWLCGCVCMDCSWAMSYERSTLASVSGFPFPLFLLPLPLLLLAIIYGMRRNGFYCKNRVSCLWHKLWTTKAVRWRYWPKHAAPSE
ncbi:hypothetical protein M5D96_005130, partial [Drosophila gunungcola]